MNERLSRQIISRSTLFLVAVVLAYGGIKCLRAAAWIHHDSVQRSSSADYPTRTPTEDGSALIFAIGCGLIVAGGFFALAAVVPLWLMERLFHAPKAILHDTAAQDQATFAKYVLHLFWWW